MSEKILREETTELSWERVKRRWILRIWLASWVLWGPLAHTVSAETLVEQDGITLSGSVRMVARGVGTCEVREASHSEEVAVQRSPVTASVTRSVIELTVGGGGAAGVGDPARAKSRELERRRDRDRIGPIR